MINFLNRFYSKSNISISNIIVKSKKGENINSINYYDLFEIKKDITIPKSDLKIKFNYLQKVFHPDVYNKELDLTTDQINKIISYINIAYNNLINEDLRIKYFLELKGLLDESIDRFSDYDFIEYMMDRNSLIEVERSIKKLNSLLQENEDKIDTYVLEIKEHFRKNNLDEIKLSFAKLRYYKRQAELIYIRLEKLNN